MQNPTLAIGALTVGLIVLSGCTTTEETVVDPGPAAPTVSESSPSPLPSETQSPGAVSFTMHEKDASGYLFNVAVTMQPLSISVDTVNAPPGRALVTFGGSGTATVTSTSPGKLAPVDNVLLATGVAAFWPGQSGICAATPEVANRMFVINDIRRENGPDGCALNFFPQRGVSNGSTLAEGASIDIPIELLGHQFQTSEADAKTLTAAIAEQSQVWLGSGSTPGYDGECVQGVVDNLGRYSAEFPNFDISVMWASTAVDGCPIPQVGN